MSTVTTKDGKSRTVKDLGWLLVRVRRHAVDTVVIRENKERSKLGDAGAWVTVNFSDGTKYETTFASFSVALKWFHRPSFSGYSLMIPSEDPILISKLMRPMTNDVAAVLRRVQR